MCGIMGFVGDNAIQNVLNGLATLEYRGYDSAGVAYWDNGVKTIKHEGRLVNVTNDIAQTKPTSHIAMGHTRWATHGPPIQINAHPHTAGNITIVHNGIIENYVELVKQTGRTMVSETDSEVIAHLIDIATGSRLLDKVMEAVKQLKGTFAIVVMSSDHPNELVVVRHRSPLVVGMSKHGAIASSDIYGLLAHTNNAYVLHDDEMAVLTINTLKFYNGNSELNKEPLHITWTAESTSLGGFETYMRKEIQEQPIAIMDTLMKNNWEDLGNFLHDLILPDILFTACGTSYNASRIGAILIEANSGVVARTKLASELSYDGTYIGPRTLLVAVSQSGETADTLSAVRHAKERGAKVLAITNVVGSSLTREADFVLHTAAGPEISVASTKAFTSQLVVLYMLSGAFRNIFAQDPMMFSEVQLGLHVASDCISDLLKQEDMIKTIAETIKDTSVLFLGRGLNAPLADEGALKLKEISYLHAEGFPAGEIKHGPIALIEKGVPVIVMVTKGRTYDKMISNIKEVQARGARVIAIASEGDKYIETLTKEVIYIPSMGELMDPIMAIVPLQLLAYHVAKYLGRDIDKPRNLAKSVTVD